MGLDVLASDLPGHELLIGVRVQRLDGLPDWEYYPARDVIHLAARRYELSRPSGGQA